jgi:hypothetical protein
MMLKQPLLGFVGAMPPGLSRITDGYVRAVEPFADDRHRLRRIAADARGSTRRRAAAIWVLKLRADPALPRLLPQILRASKVGDAVAWEAAKAIVVLPPRRFARLADHLIGSPTSSLREIGVWLTGFRKESASHLLLEQILADDPAPAVRAQAAESLGTAGASQAIGSLARALSDRSARVRASAAYALGEIGDLTILQALIAHRGDRGRAYASRVASSVRRAIRMIKTRRFQHP